MGNLARAVACLALVACQPMYGAPPDHLARLPPRPAPKGQIVIEQPIYIEDCTVDFHRAPARVARKTDAAERLVTDGDSALDSSKASADANARIDLVVRGIEKYRDALVQDPYSASATLKLAIAYDRVLRKGCALAMLRRLDALAQNPKIAPDAAQRIDDAVDNPQWFRGYRKDALAALGH